MRNNQNSWGLYLACDMAQGERDKGASRKAALSMFLARREAV
jgi:hypothetical protein